MIEPAGDDLAGGPVEQLGDRLGDGLEHLLCVLLHPAFPRMAVDLVPPGLATGCRRLSKSAALTPVVPSSMPSRSRSLITHPPP